MDAVKQKIMEYAPPSNEEIRRSTAFGRVWFKPQFLGLWELNLEKPALFVGNHSLFGITDAPLMVEHMYSQYGVMLRSLGDRGHFSVPVWRDLLIKYGTVEGSPENCAALMRSGQHILVFPGGAREVMRRKGEKHNLIWKQRAGFARLAIEHGYDIIPFGSVGPDDSYRILLDADDIARPGWRLELLKRLGLYKHTRDGDVIPPIARGIGPTLIPRPQQYYFGFGPRISTKAFQGQHGNPEVTWAVREQVADAIRQQIDRLKTYREKDRLQHWSLARRFFAPLSSEA